MHSEGMRNTSSCKLRIMTDLELYYQIYASKIVFFLFMYRIWKNKVICRTHPNKLIYNTLKKIAIVHD